MTLSQCKRYSTAVSSQSIGDVALANVQIMGKEVIIDLLMQSPSLQSRKKEEYVGALEGKIGDDYTKSKLHKTSLKKS